MSNVVDIRSQKPHIAGTAYCKACGYKWAHICEPGDFPFICPKCKCPKGINEKFLARGIYAYHCGTCNGDTFGFSEVGVYCMECGEYQDIDDIGHFDNPPPPGAA